MIRLLAALIVGALLTCAVLASNRAVPLVADTRSPGPWDFHNADEPQGIRGSAIPWLQTCNPFVFHIEPGQMNQRKGVHQV